ncbi:hypothetical protein ACFQ46_21600 [Kineococcus sp. GCM10028916]|uniref:hypothetical protein n=1 Tax=Kineococcus sp. GCM10028916 TaxID=3273394 RepID=UPI0036268A39
MEAIDTSEGNGERSSLANLFQGQEGKTLRDKAAESFQITDFGLVGSPDTVAGKVGEITEEVGGDGFLLCTPPTRLQIAEITDGLAPALRHRPAPRRRRVRTSSRPGGRPPPDLRVRVRGRPPPPLPRAVSDPR